MSSRAIATTPGLLARPVAREAELMGVSALLAFSVVLTHAPTVLRAPVVLAFICVVPGLALVRLFAIGSKVAEAALALALSLALAGMTGGVLLYAGLWSPRVVLYVLVGVTLAVTVPRSIIVPHASPMVIRTVARARRRPLVPSPPSRAADLSRLDSVDGRLKRMLAAAEDLQPEIWLIEDLDGPTRRRSQRGHAGEQPIASGRGVCVTAVGEAGRLSLDRRPLAAPAGWRGAWRSSLALEAIDGLRTLGCVPPVIAAGLQHGSLQSFRRGLERRALEYVVRIDLAAALEELAVSGSGWRWQPRSSAVQKRRLIASHLAAQHVEPELVSWGSSPALRSRFAALLGGTRPSQPEVRACRLLCEWRPRDQEPARFWLTNLPEETSLARLVSLAQLPARNNRERPREG